MNRKHIWLLFAILIAACRPAHGPIIDGSDCSQEWGGIEGRHTGGSMSIDYTTNDIVSRDCGHALSIGGWRANVYGNGDDLSDYYVIRDGEKKFLNSMFLVGSDSGVFDLEGRFYNVMECYGMIDPTDTVLIQDKYAMGIRTQSQQDCGTYIVQKKIESWNLPGQ